MGHLFSEPALDSVEHTVAGKHKFTLYDFGADVYYCEIFDREVAAGTIAYLRKKKGEEVDLDDLIKDYEAMDEVDRFMCQQRGQADQEYRFCAASLLPGFPDATFDDLLAELKVNLNRRELAAMAEKVYELVNADPKQDSPATDSSED